jgi:CheY-like chemotaxis protein
MILLVEDNEDDVFIMQQALKKLPLKYRVHLAEDGRQALDYLQGIGKYSDRAIYPYPVIIFLDLKLPKVHGFEVLTWISEQPIIKEIPVAMLTSSPEPSDRERAANLGARTFLVKPPTPEVLSEALKLIATRD